MNTQRMLESLGRGETIPAITKLQRIEQVKAQTEAQTPTLPELLEQQALLTLTRLTDAMGGGDMSDKAREAQRDAARNNEFRQIWLTEQIAVIENSTLVPSPRPGLKIHVCSLVAPDSPAGKPWMPVYIHSKLMIVNDVFTTHGSANINTRSMQVDSELNIAHEWMSVTQAMRRRLWNLHTDGRGAQDDPEEAFKAWQGLINNNKDRQKQELTPDTPLVEFYYGEKIVKDLD